MLDLLNTYEVDLTKSDIYCFKPCRMEWWDSENDTDMELHVTVKDTGQVQIAVAFSPDVEGIVELQYVFLATIQDNRVIGDTLVAKAVFEQLSEAVTLPFSDEQQAYIASDPETATIMLGAILRLSHR